MASPAETPSTPTQELALPSVESAEQAEAVPTEVLPLEETLFTTPRAPYKYFGSFNYAAIDVPIIAKYGITAGYISDPNHLWEIEYMTGSFGSSVYFADIGKITDTKISIQRRTYFGNHFNITYGLSYFNFSARLGDALMSNVSNNTYPSLDMVEIEAYGATFGMGSTWTFNKNIVLSVDWLTISQPLYVTKKETPYLDYATNPDDRDEVEAATDIVSYLPRVSLIQFHVGMMF
ncbi:hypothetical protein D3C87_1309140 [compost metagenome]